MSKLSSLPRISREDLAGAPEWVEPLLQQSNEFQEQASNRLNEDLLVGSFAEYDFVHGVEKLIKSPFGNRMPTGVSDVRCRGLEVDSAGKWTGKFYDLETSSFRWREVQTRPGQPARVGVTCKFVPTSSGAVGQSISSFIVAGSAVSLTTATAADVTSITLTAGDWDISAILELSGALTGVSFNAAVNTTSATLPAAGSQRIQIPMVSNANSDLGLSIPSFRVSITASTTYYLIAHATFTVGTAVAYGRISATRVSDYATGITGRVMLRFDKDVK